VPLSSPSSPPFNILPSFLRGTLIFPLLPLSFVRRLRLDVEARGPFPSLLLSFSPSPPLFRSHFRVRNIAFERASPPASPFFPFLFFSFFPPPGPQKIKRRRKKERNSMDPRSFSLSAYIGGGTRAGRISPLLLLDARGVNDATPCG